MKTLRPLILSLSLFGLIFMGVHGQEAEKTVHLKVIKGGEATVDTVFSASDLEDVDLHKKISELAGVDIEMIHGGDMSVHIGHKEHAGHKGHTGHKEAHSYVTVDDHEGSDGKVTKKIIIKKSGEGTETEDVTYFYSTDEDMEKGEHVYIMKGDSGTMVTKEGKEGETIEVIVKHIGEGDGDSEEVRVEITTDSELHKSHEKKGGVYVVAGDDKDGTIIVHKDVKVLKSIGEDGEVIEITVVIKEGEKEKMKEKSKETKQKKDKDRNKK